MHAIDATVPNLGLVGRFASLVHLGRPASAVEAVPNVEGLNAAAERLRAVVTDLAIAHVDNAPHGVVTVSIGATFIGRSDLDLTDEQWIAQADDELYEAKRAGRNRVSLRRR